LCWSCVGATECINSIKRIPRPPTANKDWAMTVFSTPADDFKNAPKTATTICEIAQKISTLFYEIAR
jgi:hypothetical protein